jgi:hypothetical protein
MSFNIKYLPQAEIDKSKWHESITASDNGLIYGYSFYLDKLASHWDALVLNDYEAVMPLPWNKKFDIHYLYQPFLCAQGGIFGKNIDAGLVEAFLHSIPAKFKYWDISLNHQNLYPLNHFSLYERSNFVLSLNRPYDELYNAYRESTQRNIRKAELAGCRIIQDFDVEKVIVLALQQMRRQSKESGQNVESFRQLYDFLHQQKKAITYGIESAKNELLASCVFFFSHRRAYYILVGNHPNGRTIGASHAVIDAFIKDYAGNDILLDFEGSDMRNLAFFYGSFGAVEEKYAAVKLNRLPWWLKWAKK